MLRLYNTNTSSKNINTSSNKENARLDIIIGLVSIGLILICFCIILFKI